MALLPKAGAVAAPETKASEAGPIMALHSVGRAAWTPRDYAKLAEEGYRRNVIGFAAVNKVAVAAASVPWKVFETGGDTRRELPDHDLAKLLRKPNPLMGQGEFIQNLVGYYLLAGNEYIDAVGPDNGPPLELWPLRPDRMKLVVGGTGLPSGFVYTVGGRKKTWDADPISGASPILHLKTFNPLHDFYGMSPIEAAAFAIDIRNEQDRHNKALLQNDARPSGALVYQPHKDAATNVLSPEQFDRLKSELDEQVSGASNTGRPLLLDGGLTWQQMGFKPKDMDFLNAKHSTSRDIALTFGVPPQLLGIPGDSTYSNYQEARLALWEETVIPLIRALASEFNHWLVPMFGDDLVLELDMEQVPALTLRRQSRMEAFNGADFLTVNEKRRATGFEDTDGGDVILVPATLLPLGATPEEEGDGKDGKHDPGTAEERAADHEEAYGKPSEPA